MKIKEFRDYGIMALFSVPLLILGIMFLVAKDSYYCDYEHNHTLSATPLRIAGGIVILYDLIYSIGYITTRRQFSSDQTNITETTLGQR